MTRTRVLAALAVAPLLLHSLAAPWASAQTAEDCRTLVRGHLAYRLAERAKEDEELAAKRAAYSALARAIGESIGRAAERVSKEERVMLRFSKRGERGAIRSAIEGREGRYFFSHPVCMSIEKGKPARLVDARPCKGQGRSEVRVNTRLLYDESGEGTPSGVAPIIRSCVPGWSVVGAEDGSYQLVASAGSEGGCYQMALESGASPRVDFHEVESSLMRLGPTLLRDGCLAESLYLKAKLDPACHSAIPACPGDSVPVGEGAKADNRVGAKGGLAPGGAPAGKGARSGSASNEERKAE